MENQPYNNELLPLPEVVEIETKKASQWEHELDKTLHSKSVQKSWCDTVSSVAKKPIKPIFSHDLIEYEK